MRLLAIAVAMLLALATPAMAQQFPNMIGYGKATTGGRLGTIYKVTNLNDSGAGSLRDCAEATGARVCIITVGGVLTLQSPIQPPSNFGIYGLGGGGLSIALDPAYTNPNGKGWNIFLMKNGANGIIRNVAFRGTFTTTAPNGNCFMWEAWNNGYIDHYSCNWQPDQLIGSYGAANNITIAYGINAEGLWDHAKGALIGADSQGAPRYHTLYRNIFWTAKDRMPDFKNDAGCFQFYENVVGNWESAAAELFGFYPNATKSDFRHNVWIPGANTSNGDYIAKRQTNPPEVGGSKSYFPNSGLNPNVIRPALSKTLNWYDPNGAGAGDDTSAIIQTKRQCTLTAEPPMVADPFTITRGSAGARPLDSFDQKILAETANPPAGTNKPTASGTMPTRSASAWCVDSDGDAMCDSIEPSVGAIVGNSDAWSNGDSNPLTNAEQAWDIHRLKLAQGIPPK